MPENDNDQLNNAHEFSEPFTNEDAISDIENDSVREFLETEGTWLRGRDYPDYVIEELYTQDRFDLDGKPR